MSEGGFELETNIGSYRGQENGDSDLYDYKFFCFNGKVKGLYVASDRNKKGEDLKIDFYDENYNHLPVRQSHENAKELPVKPIHFEQMKKAAEKLSQGIPYVRVDFYDLGNKTLFGELTFFSFSGMLPYQPSEWDKIFGDMLTLPGEKMGGAIIRLNENGEMFLTRADLPDYKWYCFDGMPKYCQVIQNRSSKETIDFFDTEWNHQEFVGFNPKAENAEVEPQKPDNLELQLKIASQLAKDKPYSRIDLYSVDSKLYFGEITLYPMSGMGKIRPEKYDEILGQMITLPGAAGGGYLIKVGEVNLYDYKFFCFNGIPQYCQVISGRGNQMCIDFFDMNWLHQPFHEPKDYPFAKNVLEKPKSFHQMLEAAYKLSQDKPFVRIDFYDVNGKMYFGEITFFPTSGIGGFSPKEWDYKFGNRITLPS